MLRKNIIANYVSQAYVTIVGIALLPIYIKYMGSEAYGLVGFFAMLQAWFGILDLGLTPTISRETARFQGGALSAFEFKQLYRVLSLIFSIVAIIGGGCLFLISDIISTDWLKIESLSKYEVVISVQIMAVSVALRWMCGLYRGVVSGFERLVWLSGFNAIVATLRFVGVFVSMWSFGYTPIVFFTHQLCVALLEIFGLWLKTYFLIPNNKQLNQKVSYSFAPIRPLLKFSLTVAFTAGVWVFVTQTDKLVLSGILSLKDYGYFTLAVLVANGIMVIGGPISSAIMPRMARLHAENKHDEMITIYHQCTQLVAIIAGSAAITLIVAAEPLLNAWTGDESLAKLAAPILRFYAAGNLFLAMSAFVYYLQYAKGDLRYHFIGNIGLAIVLIPSIVLSATYYGGEGAGLVWLIANALFFTTWCAYVHYKLEPGLHVKWLKNDVIKVIGPSLFVALLISNYDAKLSGRIENISYVMVVAFVIISISFCCSRYRTIVINAITSKKLKSNSN
jgi:O-antigen/teichoic acid export membrane protein